MKCGHPLLPTASTVLLILVVCPYHVISSTKNSTSIAQDELFDLYEVKPLNLSKDNLISDFENNGDDDVREQETNQVLGEGVKHFTHEWAVHIQGGIDKANRVAETHNFDNLGEVRKIQSSFLFKQIS